MMRCKLIIVGFNECSSDNCLEIGISKWRICALEWVPFAIVNKRIPVRHMRNALDTIYQS